LIDLTLAGIRLQKESELIQLMTALPNLVNLGLVDCQMGRFYEEHRNGGASDGGVGSLSESELPAHLNLGCLSVIMEKLPHLKMLTICVVSCPTAGLSHALSPFKSLESLRFTGPSLRNCRLAGFSVDEAALFISSYLPPSCTFAFSSDISLLRKLHPRRNDPNNPVSPTWLAYANYFDILREKFEAMVNVAVRARADERARLGRAPEAP
jgi:hypothetical protein